jgi:glycosyltransferase involved in cell wall biosynthesis
VKISVIIPVYNAEKYISRCLDSVVNQTYKDWEVIAIDDGSKDNSYSILSEYSFRDKRFKVSSHNNQGPGYTRNKAIEFITGDYIVFLDSDDYIETTYFEDLVICSSKNDSDVVFIDVIQENPDGKLIKYENMSKYKNSSKDRIIRHQMTGKLPWGGWRKAVKSRLITDNNIKYSKDAVGEEALFSFRVLMEARNISFLDKPYYHYVNYPNSQSKKGDDDPWGAVCSKISEYLQENGLFNEYKKTINSFGFTAFIVSVYRMSQNNSVAETVKLSKVALKRFKSIYSFDLDKDSLEMRTKCVLPFTKMGLVFPIVLVAKIKSVI